jgi:membrane fusion protein (multidrug efflux system)
VNDRQVEPGEYIHSGTPVFKVVNIDRLKLVLDIPERDITAISDGKHIPFTVNALPGQTFTGTVRFVAVLAARQSNAFRVEAHVENPDHILLPGMIARADVIRGVLTDSMVVPLSAIVPKKGDHVVFINDAGHALRRVVHIHRITGSNAILSSGLSQGDALIVQGHRSLVDGAPVRAVNE